MTDILILQGHPDPSKSHLCHAIADSYRTAAEQNGHRVHVIAVADQDIPYVRSKADWESTDLPPVAVEGQAAVRAAEHIVLIYPLWMGDVPAMLKAWIEQVLREGFAFDVHRTSWKAALKGKSARVIVTMGMPSLAYRWFFFAHSLRSLDRNVLKFCGIRPVRWSIFGNAEDPTGKAQKRFLEKAAKLGKAAQ
ncbi:MAG: NAD(P)H-dependent oxidoreductase [Sulfitobacter sp.]